MSRPKNDREVFTSRHGVDGTAGVWIDIAEGDLEALEELRRTGFFERWAMYNITYEDAKRDVLNGGFSFAIIE